MKTSQSSFNRRVGRLQKAGQRKALRTFHEAAKRVPAYKDFLAENSVNPKSIRTFSDFSLVPPVTKENYLRRYPLKDLMWDGNEFNGDFISVSSGSSGEPFFWLRDSAQHAEAGEIYTGIYKDIFQADTTPTLLVICFSMGIWIAGSYTTLGAMAAKQSGLKMNIITPALDITDSIAVIKRLQKGYQQIILAGYPPFLKDLVDKGKEAGIDWRKLKVGFTAAGESINEELRDYFIKHGTIYNDPTKIISIYGTVDAGILGHETPLTINLRRLIYKHGQQEIFFGRSVLPTLAQYNPLHKYIEEVDGNIVFTSATALPLVRYNIKDAGSVVNDLASLIVDEPEFFNAVSKSSLNIKDWAKPFVYVHGRKDFTASLYAVLIYPENIKKALLTKELTEIVSGRFVMSVKHRKNLDQYLEIVVELKNGVKTSAVGQKQVLDTIINTLSADNFEYRKLKASIGSKAVPSVILKEANDPELFSRTSNKQRWTAEAIKNR
jgi:phenylacetate-CoA ligase